MKKKQNLPASNFSGSIDSDIVGLWAKSWATAQRCANNFITAQILPDSKVVQFADG